MASQPFRPSDAPLPSYGTQPPLQFVSSSFTVQEQVGGQPYGGGGYGAGPSTSAYAPVPNAYGGQSFGGPAVPMGRQQVGTLFAASASFDDEPPLLEELGIDVPHILRKTRSMLRPFRTDPSLCDDGDLMGPLIFALLLGSAQLLAGKVNFGVILGWSVVTMTVLHWLFNLLAGPSGLDFYRCSSLLGYCLLPVVLFSAAAIVLPAKSAALWLLGALATGWSTSSASKLLTAIAPGLEGQRALVAYPCALAYGLFTLLTIA